MTVCWAQGAAHGVWKEMARRVVDGREDLWEEKSSSVLISVREDIARNRGGIERQCEARSRIGGLAQ